MRIEIDVEEFAQQIKEGKGLSRKDADLPPPDKTTYRNDTLIQAEITLDTRYHKKP